MRKQSITIIIILLFVSTSIFSKDKLDYLFQKLSIESAPGSVITSIIQDDKGYIWIGTFWGLSCYDGYNKTIFKNIPSDNGSYNNRVSNLEKDSLGNLWIGREFDNLCILNLSTFHFMHIGYKVNNKKLIPSSITAIKTVNKNEIWIGTKNGNVYNVKYYQPDKKKDSIVLIPSEVKIKTDSPENLSMVNTIVLFNEYILIGYENGGLVCINSKSLGNNPVKGRIIEPLPVTCVTSFSGNNLWVGTHLGIHAFKYLPDSKEFINSTPRFSDWFGHINSIVEDNSHNIYISTSENGLFVASEKDIKKNEVTLINYNKQNSNLFSNRLKSLYIDRSNKLWIGTNHQGVGVADLSQKRFLTINYCDENVLNNDIIISRIFEDSKNRLWIGTNEDGLYCYDQTRNKRYHRGINKFKTYEDSRIIRMYEDHAGNIWFCSLAGLYYLPNDEIFTEKTVFSKIKNDPLSTLPASSISEDEYHNYWIAANGDLYKIRIDFKTNTILSKTQYHKGNAIHDLPEGYIYNMNHTEKNTLWIGSMGGGMSRITYNGQNDKIIIDKYSPAKHNGFYVSNINVWWFLNYNDSLWVGTDDGLNLYTRNDKNQFMHKKTWYVKDGLPSNEIGAILNDKQGNLWMDTGNGLSKLLTDRHTFANFNFPDELQNNCIAPGTYKSPFMYFRTLKGLYYFDPNEIRADSIPPHTIITNLQIYNEEVHPDDKINGQVILEKRISYSKEIFLSYKNNNFSLQFSAFNFALPQTNEYLYILEGFDNKWMNTYNHGNSVTYANLPAGKYLFKVKAINSDGITDIEPAVLKITIGGPPWKSWWAYTLYCIVIIAGIIVMLKYYRNKIRLEQEILLEKRKREQEHELTEMKINFYTNISHELRTPLTLISAPVSEIKKGGLTTTKLNDLLNLVFISTDKLMKLVNQLLDFSKIEQETTPLKVKQTDIVTLLKKIYQSFKPLALQKNITLTFLSAHDEFTGFIDEDVADKIISNLVFNAIKYTPDCGKVTIHFEVSPHEQGLFYHIEVTDTGTGIEPEKLEKIFEKYYQQEQGEGYGIGLSLVKKLVLLHYGTIEVKSGLKAGTTFTVEFPAFESAYVNDMDITEYKENTTDEEETGNDNEAGRAEKRNKKVILVAEDNNDLREYLCKKLSDKYDVLEAPNGKIALQLAIEYLPDLIISDVMMPEMDGVAFSTAIKSDMHTNHIPFIFLTAKDGIQNQKKGLLTGAEDYIVKPFDIVVLRRKIHNLLRLIETTCEKQRKLFLFEPQEVEKTSKEDEFIKKATQIIRKNISNRYFNAEMLSSEMSMSRMHLYRKLKQLNLSPAEFINSIKSQYANDMATDTERHPKNDIFIQSATKIVYENISNTKFGPEQFSAAMALNYMQLHRKLKGTISMSAAEFIRSIRMKHAAELLKTDKYRVSEVMYKVGFDDPSYFTKVFKQQFGKTPTEYLGK